MAKCPNRSLPEYKALLAEYKTNIATDNVINAWQDLNKSEAFPTIPQAQEFIKEFKMNQTLQKQEFGLALLNNLSRLGYAGNNNGVYYVRTSKSNDMKFVDSNRTKIQRYLEFNNIPLNAVTFAMSPVGNTYTISVDTEVFGPKDILPERRGFDEPKTLKILDHLNSVFPELNIQVATVEQARNYYDNLPANMKANVKFDDLKSFYVNGKAYLVKGRVTDDTAVEEVLHPFVDTLFYQNRELFDNLLKEARTNFPKLAEQIDTAYSTEKGFSQDDRSLELVTQALSRHFNDEYENAPTKTFLQRIREFLEWFMSIINDYHKYLTGVTIDKAAPKIEIKNVVYSAVFFDTTEVINKYPSVHSNVYSHHSTIEFKPKDVNSLPIGQNTNIKIIGRLTTDKVDTLIVENPLSKNKFPHITLSTAEGVKPFESNAEIEKNQDKIIKVNDSISGTIGVFDGKNEIISEPVTASVSLPVTAIKPSAKLSDIARLLNTSMLKFENIVYDTNQVKYALSEEKQKIVDKALDQSNDIQKNIISRMFSLASAAVDDVDTLSAGTYDITENSTIVVLNKKNHVYYDIVTGEAYTSATTAIKGKLKNEEDVQLNITLGNDFDFILDSIISNKTLKEVLESNKIEILNEEQVKKAFDNMQEIVQDLTADGSVAISQVALYDRATRIAGTADLVIITPQGKLKILDLKTSKSWYASIKEQYDKEWDLEEDSLLKKRKIVDRLSTRQQHNLQLNLYRRMAENMGYEMADDEYATSTFHIHVDIKGKGKDQVFTGDFEPEGWVAHPPSQNKVYVDQLIPVNKEDITPERRAELVSSNIFQNEDFTDDYLDPEEQLPEDVTDANGYTEFNTVFNALQQYKTALMNRRDAIERIKSGIYMDRRTEQIIENIDNTVGAIMVALSEGGSLISSTYTDLLRDAVKEVDQFTEYMLNPENFDKNEYINYALNFDRFLVTFNGLTEIQNSKDVNATQSKLLLSLETKLRALGGTRTKSGIIDAAIMNYVKETVRNTTNREFTEDELNELMKSARDITAMDLNTRDMATSPDTILAIMDKIYKAKKQELYDKIDLREEEIRAAASKLLKLSPTSDRNKIYDFMLEYDDKGNFTGRYVKPLGKQYYDKIDQLRSKLFDEEGNWKEYREVDDITTANPEDIAYNKELYEAKQAYTEFWRAEKIGVDDKPVDGEYHGYTDEFKQARAKHEVFVAEGKNGYWVRKRGISDKIYMNYKLKYFDTVETKFAVKKNGVFTGKVTDGTITVPKVKYRFAREISSKGEDMRNPKYKDIMNPTDALGEARKEFYELYVKHYEDDLLKKLPTSVRDKMLGKAPLVESNLVNSLKGSGNLVTKLWAKTTRSVKNLTTQTSEMRRVVVDETGQFVDTLPIFFVGNARDEEALAVIEAKIDQLSKERKLGAINKIDYDKQKAELEGKAAAIRSKPSTNEISTDLGDSLLKFSAMAEHYETMGTIEDTLNAMIYVLERREYEPADDRITRVARIAGKVTKVGQKKGDVEPNTVRRAKKFMSMVFYDSDEITKGMTDKIVDKLINASSMTYVAFNPFGNFNNYVMGRLNNGIEALGQRFVSRAAYARATVEFNKRALPDVVKRFGMGGYKLGLGGQYDPTLPMSKYEAFVDFFRMMDQKADVRESRGSTGQKSWFGEFFEKVGYGIQDAAEYNVQTKMGMAIVMDTMLKNKTTGETLSLYDAAEFDSVTHKLKFKDGFDTIIKKNGVEVKFDNKFRYDLRNRIREVNKQIHGNYAREDRMVIQSYALGKLAAQFHKWVAPAVRARFGKEYFDENLGWMEGRYMSFWSFMGYFFRNLNKIEMTGKKMKEGFLKDYGYIGDGSQADAKAENKLYNMYRTLGELGIIISVMIAKQILNGMWSDDDDDSEFERRLENALLFQADRSVKEMRTFIPVFGFSDLYAMAKSPIAATRTLAEYGQALGSTMLTGYNGIKYMATDNPEYWEGNKDIVYQNRPDKGKLKMAKEWRDAIPMLYTWQRWESYTKISDFYIK